MPRRAPALRRDIVAAQPHIRPRSRGAQWCRRPEPLSGAPLSHRVRCRDGTMGTEIAAYYYGFSDSLRREIIGFHLPPEEVPAVSFPHLHIGHGAVDADFLRSAGQSAARNALRRDLASGHLPTGPIAFADVVRLAIEQFGVRSRRAHWDRAL